jgi:sec-independent protein translocase protein TatA
MLGNLTGWHMVIILAIVLLLFGAAKLPALAQGLGQSIKIFKSEVDAGQRETVASSPDNAATALPSTPTSAPLAKP